MSGPFGDQVRKTGNVQGFWIQKAVLKENGWPMPKNLSDSLDMVIDYAKILHQPAAGEDLVLVAESGWQGHIQRGETTVPNSLESQAGFKLA